MAEKKDPTKITLREAAELYRTQGIGTQNITRFKRGNSFGKYGDMPVVEAFAGERGSRPIDEMFAQTKSAGAYNDLARDLRFVSIPVRRDIALITPDSPVISSFPGADAADEQTKIVFGQRKATDVARDIRILSQNTQGWGELFTTLEEMASNPNNPKAAVADAVLATLYTGPRGGLIANLKGDEYKPDSASVRVMPQTKEKKLAGEKKDAGAQKEGGLRGKAIPYNVPLSEEGTAYIERRLRFNESNPEVRKFIEQSGENRIFVKINEKGVPSKVTTTDMSNLLADIEVSEPLIEDAVSGKTYKSLYPKEVTDKKTGKWGEALARDFHAAVALNELEISGQTVDFLHGRSETSGTAGRSQTRKLGYGRRATSYFTKGERNAQQRVANFISSLTGKTAADIPDVDKRVTPATYSIPGFFDKQTPVETTKVPAPETPKTAPTLPSPELQDAMTKAGFKIDFKKLADRIGKGVKGAVFVELGRQFIDDPLDTAGEIAKEMGIEGAARLAGLGNPQAIAASMVLGSSTETATGLLRPEEGSLSYSGLQPSLDESMMKNIAIQDSAMRLKPEAGRDFIPAPEVEEDNFLTMQP